MTPSEVRKARSLNVQFFFVEVASGLRSNEMKRNATSADSATAVDSTGSAYRLSALKESKSAMVAKNALDLIVA